MGELSTGERMWRGLAGRTSRRGFLGKMGRGVVALVGGGLVASVLESGRAEAHHICGHTFTTGSCPHPYAPLTRIDRYGWPLHPTYGFPVDDEGAAYLDRRSQVRHRTCEEQVHREYPFVRNARHGGGWTRCCGGRLRHISDCCSRSRTRINGDGAVRGYCPRGRFVFCITYRELTRRC
jgi:hypothetical protein